MWRWFLVILGVTTMSFAAGPERCRLEKTTYNGWSVYRLTNGIVNLYLAPQLGGRAIQIELGHFAYLYVNKGLAGKVLPKEQNNPEAGWANYGGDKVWPAPEGWSSDEQWPSVPYYILDGSSHTAEVIQDSPEEVALRMTSPPDPRTGIQFERTFHLRRGSTRIQVVQVMRNISRRKVRWGIWHVTQHNGADLSDPSQPNPALFAYAPLNPQSMHPGGYYQIYGDARHPSYQTLEDGRLLRAQYLYRVGKIGVDSHQGWLAVVNGQTEYCFVETFQHFPDRPYPDNASIEFWNHGPGTVSRGPYDQVLPDDPEQTPYFFESEVISPYAELEPGEEYKFRVNWWLSRSHDPVRNVTWAGVVSEPLSAEPKGDKVTLRGSFGVFHAGTREATFYNKLGQILAREDLGAIDPRDLYRLQKSVSLPQETFRITVGLRDADGESLGILGNVMLK